MNKILILLSLLSAFACNKNKCDIEKGISNYDSNLTFKDIGGIYSDTNKDIIIKILANKETQFIAERGDLIIYRKIKSKACQINGHFIIGKTEDQNTLICYFDDSIFNFIRIAKINNDPVLLLHNSFFDPSNCSKIQNEISTECNYLTLRKE